MSRREAVLEAGLRQLDLPADGTVRDTLLRYLDLMKKWNQTYNLTAIRDESSLVPYHLLDSLSVMPSLTFGSLADVGSGAGLPGIPLAICDPGRAVTLIEASGKKTAFLTQTKLELRLDNVAIANSRVEDHRAGTGYSCVISRAFADLADFVHCAGHLCESGGLMLAMKGVYPHDELARLPAQWQVKEVLPLKVPGLDADRHLVVMNRRGNVPGTYH